MWIYLTLLNHILKDGKIYNMWVFCFVFHLFACGARDSTQGLRLAGRLHLCLTHTHGSA